MNLHLLEASLGIGEVEFDLEICYQHIHTPIMYNLIYFHVTTMSKDLCISLKPNCTNTFGKWRYSFIQVIVEKHTGFASKMPTVKSRWLFYTFIRAFRLPVAASLSPIFSLNMVTRWSAVAAGPNTSPCCLPSRSNTRTCIGRRAAAHRTSSLEGAAKRRGTWAMLSATWGKRNYIANENSSQICVGF